MAFEGGAVFHGRYLEVTPHSRIVWTNEENGEGGAVTTVTFEENGRKTVVAVLERYPLLPRKVLEGISLKLFDGYLEREAPMALRV